jgi:hypothetical protein
LALQIASKHCRYVNAFCLIAREVPSDKVELALAGASLADTFGILLADLSGLMIQGCIYGYHNMTDSGKPPNFECGYSYDAVNGNGSANITGAAAAWMLGGVDAFGPT